MADCAKDGYINIQGDIDNLMKFKPDVPRDGEREVRFSNLLGNSRGSFEISY